MSYNRRGHFSTSSPSYIFSCVSHTRPTIYKGRHCVHTRTTFTSFHPKVAWKNRRAGDYEHPAPTAVSSNLTPLKLRGYRYWVISKNIYN